MSPARHGGRTGLLGSRCNHRAAGGVELAARLRVVADDRAGIVEVLHVEVVVAGLEELDKNVVGLDLEVVEKAVGQLDLGHELDADIRARVCVQLVVPVLPLVEEDLSPIGDVGEKDGTERGAWFWFLGHVPSYGWEKNVVTVVQKRLKVNASTKTKQPSGCLVLVGRLGIEPRTLGLRGLCSTS